jgi:hypothetical integral membrane protein (TIGR02206 family)
VGYSFLDTVESIPDGYGFAYFGPQHLLWLVIISIVCTFVSIAYVRGDDSHRRTMRIVIVTLIFCDEAFKQAALLVGHHWWANYLPLHLCSINMVLCLWHCIKPCEANKQLLYGVCLPCAIAAVLLPGWARVPAFTTAQAINGFTFHLLLIAYPLMLLVSGEVRPRMRYLPACLGYIAAIAAVIYPLNKVLDTNFMFLDNAADAFPLTVFEAQLGDPGYILPLALIVIAVDFLVFLPWPFINRKRDAKTTLE